MILYLDADIFLALIKEEDRHKKAAQQFLRARKGQEWITSSIACLEVWFYLYKNGLSEKALGSVMAIGALCKVTEVSYSHLQAAALLAQHSKLSPADAVHATLALSYDGIVSSDTSFDRVSGLKRVDFSNGAEGR